MPYLQVLRVSRIRNIEDEKIVLDPRLNIVWGENGSGKTSLLESIYLLSTGKSFRAHKTDRIIQTGSATGTVHGTLAKESGAVMELAIQKDRQRPALVNVAGLRGESQGKLARELPVLAITPESHALIEEGPDFRRRYLDWGVFHVEPAYHAHWQRYMRALKQRNALLKQGRDFVLAMEAPWRAAMAQEGERVHGLRSTYLDQLRPVFTELAHELVVGFEGLELRYMPGWREDWTLAQALEQGLDKDFKYMSCQSGPHRADLVVHDNEGPVQSRVSRGQQKLVIYALRLAQIKLLIQRHAVYPVVLLDDLPAELDELNLRRVLGMLTGFGCQVVVTAIEAKTWSMTLPQPPKLFHVKQGRVLYTADIGDESSP